MSGTTIELTTVGLFFTVLAALSAFTVSYVEYERHFHDKRTAARLAVRTALVMLALFVMLCLAASAIVLRFLSATETR